MCRHSCAGTVDKIRYLYLKRHFVKSIYQSVPSFHPALFLVLSSSMRLALVSTQLLLTQALQLAPGVKPRLATGGLTVLTPAAAHAASATYDFGYRLERSLDPDKRGPSPM